LDLLVLQSRHAHLELDLCVTWPELDVWIVASPL
jgi:hypothetical protein